MLGIFSCPSGAKVSWSRAPPPKVMTIIFRFLAAAAPRTNGLAPIRVVPNATPAALRKKSRRLRPRWLESSRGLNAASVMAWLMGLCWLNRRIAELQPFPCRLQPYALRVAAGRFRILPERDPSAPHERSPGQGGNGRREDSDSIRVLAH